MRLSCLPVSFFSEIISGRMALGQWASLAAAAGLDAIDLSILFLENRVSECLTAARDEIEDRGMKVAVVNTYPDLTHPDPDERKSQLSRLEGDIKTAALLGAEIVRVTAGQAHPGTSRGDGIAWAIGGLKASLDAAEQHGVRLAYENHSKPGCWEYTDFSHPTDIFLQVADAVVEAGMGILFDTANPLAYGDDPLPVLEKVINHVICVHAADTGKRGALEPVLVGTGLVPFDAIFRKLKGAGFKGLISIEEASGSGQAGVLRAVEFIRSTWETV